MPIRSFFEVRRRFSQTIARHLHARQFGSKPTDLHLLGVDFVLAVSPLEFAFALRLDPVVKCLVDDSQCTGRPRNALATLDQPHRFLLEFERVLRSCRLRHFRSPCVNLNTQQEIRFSGARPVQVFVGGPI